jgi:hypothetical protein
MHLHHWHRACCGSITSRGRRVASGGGTARVGAPEGAEAEHGAGQPATHVAPHAAHHTVRRQQCHPATGSTGVSQQTLDSAMRPRACMCVGGWRADAFVWETCEPMPIARPACRSAWMSQHHEPRQAADGCRAPRTLPRRTPSQTYSKGASSSRPPPSWYARSCTQAEAGSDWADIRRPAAALRRTTYTSR